MRTDSGTSSSHAAVGRTHDEIHPVTAGRKLASEGQKRALHAAAVQRIHEQCEVSRSHRHLIPSQHLLFQNRAPLRTSLTSATTVACCRCLRRGARVSFSRPAKVTSACRTTATATPRAARPLRQKNRSAPGVAAGTTHRSVSRAAKTSPSIAERGAFGRPAATWQQAAPAGGVLGGLGGHGLETVPAEPSRPPDRGREAAPTGRIAAGRPLPQSRSHRTAPIC